MLDRATRVLWSALKTKSVSDFVVVALKVLKVLSYFMGVALVIHEMTEIVPVIMSGKIAFIILWPIAVWVMINHLYEDLHRIYIDMKRYAILIVDSVKNFLKDNSVL